MAYPECLWTVEETRIPSDSEGDALMALSRNWPKASRVGRYLRYAPADVIGWFRTQQGQGGAA